MDPTPPYLDLTPRGVFLLNAFGFGFNLPTANVTNVKTEAMMLVTKEAMPSPEFFRSVGDGASCSHDASSCSDMGPSHNLRRHQAVVEILFDTESYSITYLDSTNLKYDGAEIHQNYNSWVRNLSNAIYAQISSI
jgi:hypothetical protein